MHQNHLQPHSDMRDLHTRYLHLSGTNEDIKLLKRDYVRHTRLALWTWVPLAALGVLIVYDARVNKRKFEVRYLSDSLQKEYEAEDYQYKFWEFALAAQHAKYGDAISSDNSKTNYVLMYHSSLTNPNHTAMQRFARLKRYLLLRKQLPLECVFVAMDTELDPKLLLEYVKTYSEDVIPCWAGNEDNQATVKQTFLNLGCLYLFERESGNVIYIIDPAKFPLESLSNKILYTIGKYEDRRASREWTEKAHDVRIGQEDTLSIRKANY